MSGKPAFKWDVQILMRGALVGGALVLLLTLAAPEARAGTITVTTAASGTGGAGDCTLQEAIQAANTDTAVDACAAGSGADTILIGNCTVTLLGPFQTDPTDGPIGLPDITTDITVQGLVSNVCIIERSAAAVSDFSIFRVAAGGILTIENLTVRNGKGMVGGGVINRGTLNVNFSVFENNQATGTAGGGAIANLAGATLNVTGSTFTNNSATGGAGGAILNEGPLTVSSTTFSGNSASTRGGAIDTFDIPGADTTVGDSSFFGNTAGTFGGAVHHHLSALTVTTSDFFSNSAVDGGAAIEGFGAWQITDSYFESNIATAGTGEGGALRYIGDSMMVSGSTFSNNFAGGTGGGIHLNGAPSPNVKVVNSTLSGNMANNGVGGGINLLTGSIELNNVTITANQSLNGGGISVSSTASSFVTRNSIIAANGAVGSSDDCLTEAPAVLTSQGHNLIGDNTGCTFTPGAGDIFGTGASPVDPMLGFLQPLGGFTPTHPLRPGSPALNAGDPGTPGTGGTTCEATDQRGEPRPDPVFGVCDIGAYEGVLPLADLAVTKTDTPDPVTFGSNITYTITVTNNGPDTAQAVTLSDTMPNATGFVSATPSQGSCPPPFGSQLVCDLGDMTNGSVATVALIFNANQAGTITNSVSAFSTGDEANFVDNFASEDTTVLRDFDLAITKTDTPDPVIRGNDITYDIVVANQGAATINNVVVTDTLSGAAVNFVSATPSQGSCVAGPPISCDLGAIAGQGSVNITIVVTTTVPGTVSNTASVTTSDTDPDTTNNSVTISTNVQGLADLSLAKTDSPDPVAAGANVTFTIVVTNNGPDAATGVTVFDFLGIGGTGVSIMTTQGTCSPGTGESSPSCDLGTLASGASATVTFVASADFPCLLDNFASVTANEFDAVPGNNTATTTTTVGAGAPAGTADVSVTKTGPASVLNGDNATYTLVVSNAGPDPATTVTLTDPLPTQATLVSATPTQGSCSGTTTITCDLGTINSMASATVTIVATLSTATPINQAQNQANVTAAETDPNLGNNSSAIVSTDILPKADLTTSITDSPDPVTVGGTLTYTATLTNNGPDLHTGSVIFGVALPVSVNIVSFPPVCTQQPQPNLFDCSTGDLGAGVTLMFVFVTTPTAAGTITADAIAGPSPFDPNNSNNTSSTTTMVTAGTADLSVTKTDAPDPVAAGMDLTYTVTVSNAGPDDATNTVLTDTLPAGVNFVSATASQGTCSQAASTVTCNLGTVTTSTPATVTIVVQPTAAAGSSISNTASVTSDAADPDTANNSATTSTTVTLPTLIGPSPYLSINDSPFLAAIQAGTVALETNEDGRFDVPGVTVNGGSPIAPSGITDSVDGDDGAINGSGTGGRSFFFGSGSTGITFTFNAAALGGLPTQAGIVWTDGQGTTTFEAFDAAGASLGVVGPVSLDDGSISGTTGEDRFFGVTHAGGISAIRISNTAGGIEVDHLQYGPVPAAVNSDLTITKTAAPDPVDAGTNVAYTIVVTNSGVGTASGVTLIDILPAGTAFVSATPSQGTCTGTTTVSCDLGSLGTGAQATVTIVATVTGAGTINNTATVASGSNELFVFNNSATSTSVINAMADLSIAKTDSPDPVAATDNLTYTLTITNAGPSPATGPSITDTLPAGVTFVSATGPGATCNGVGGFVFCGLANLAVGASVDVTIVVTPTAPGTITNTALVSSEELDPNPNNNTATQDTTVVAASADLQLTKTDSPDPAIVNQNLTYTLTVTNNGPQSAQNVVLTDTLPAAVTFVSASAPCTQAGGIVNCDLGTLASGAQTVITIVVTPTAEGSLTNTATVSSSTADPNPANNSASATTTASAVPFTVSFPQGQPSSTTVNSGGAVTITVTITPNQPGIIVTPACGSPLPPETTCRVQPSFLNFPDLTPQTVTFTLQTTICILAGNTPPRGPHFPMGDIRVMWPMLLALTLLLWVGLARRNEQWKRLTPVVVLLLFVVLMSGCASGSGTIAPRTQPSGTLPGTYVLPLTFTSGGQSQTLNFTLVVNL